MYPPIRSAARTLAVLFMCCSAHAQTFVDEGSSRCSVGDAGAISMAGDQGGSHCVLYTPQPSAYSGLERKRTPGTIGMIVGGSIIAAGFAGDAIASGSHENTGEGLGPGIYILAVGFGVGFPTLGISGLVFAFNKIFPNHHGLHLSAYNTTRTIGIAYKF